MSQSENNESPPIIFKETTKLLEAMEHNEDKIYESKCVLDHKQTYYEQLQQHETRLNKIIAEKRASLSILNDRASLVNTNNSYYRGKGKKICDSCNAVHQDISDIEVAFVECEDKIEEMSERLATHNDQYDKKLDELIKLLHQLTEKRKKKLDVLAEQEKALLNENMTLKNQLLLCEKENSMLEDVSDIEELEDEFKHLQSKLSILNENYAKNSDEERSYEIAKEAIENKYHESVFTELETKFTEITTEIEQLSEDVDKHKGIEQETVASYQTLEDYEKKLNEELSKTSQFWEELSRNECEGFSKIEQEIGEIKAAIVERNEKHSILEAENTKLVECLKKKDDEIEEVGTKVGQLETELAEVEGLLENLNSSDDLIEQYEKMSDKINDICNEKKSFENISLEQENAICKTVNLMDKQKEKEELEILTLENNNLLEVKNLEKHYAKTEASKAELENNVKSCESQVKSLEDSRTAHKEKVDIIAKDLNNIDIVFEECQRNLKIISMKKKEVKQRLTSFTAPPPIYLNKDETTQSFTKPKIPEPAKKVQKKTASPKPKRNWDSDSSVEGDVIKLSDVLKKKHKRINKNANLNK